MEASQRHWSQAVWHLPSIIAFSLRVAVAKWLGVHAERELFRATLLCEACEFAILASSGRRSSTTDASVVPLISFVAALQKTSFDRVGPWPFNSAMTTGNLRNASRISKGLRPLTPFSPG